MPQGSVLSPSLYNIFVHDIPLPFWGKIILYVDDTVILASCRLIKKLVKNIKKSARRITEFYKKWKISVNGEKTVLMFHTRRRRLQVPPESIELNGSVIPRSAFVKYLGFHLDNRLTFKNHIAKSLVKTDNLCKILYPVIGRNSLASKMLKLKIYKTYVRPSLLYAAPILDTVAPTNKKMLQTRQNKFLRLVMEKNRRTRVTELHDACRIETVNDHIRKQKIKFVGKCENSNNVNIVNMSR